jgi:hypothetical protein
VNGTETLKTAVKDGAISGDLAEEMITLSHCELGWMPKEARDAIIDKVLDAAGGNAEMAQWMMEIVGRCDRAELADVDARVRRVADQVAEGLAETARAKAGNPEGREPQTAYEGAVNAERMKGTELRSVDGGVMACERFPEVTVEIDQDGIHVRGMTDALMSKPENAADAAALLSRLEGIAKQNGQMVDFGGDMNAETVARGIIDEVNRGGLERTQRKLETRSRLFEVLMESQLGNGVSYDEASFAAALGKLENGRKFRDNHGNIYGFKDADGVLHFNPTALNLNTPIHEYGHLALEALRKVNPTLLKRGMDLIAGSDYYGEIRRNSETEGHEYSYLKGKEEWLRDEALATMIGDRGQRLVEQKGLGAELKAWMKEFWKALKGAFGVADLTDEQIEKMSLGEFVDAVNAELLRGKEFGTRKQRPLEKRSITRYDEDQGSGANGMLRWRNDRGYLFALPVDMERTRPGGKVVLARDDANITDWIQSRLNGVELRMSKNGKIYVKGANGLEGELAEIFGRYPTIGKNDGIFDAIAAELPAVGASGATPEALVEALRKDRANYDAWTAATHDGKTLEALREERRAADEAEREEFEARERYERSGMEALDYVRSRIDEGEPGFDIDWETMREIAREAEQGKFAIGGIFTGSTADYANRSRQGGVDDGPSLVYVGKGEGTQVYGYGLYGSTLKNDAEYYAAKAQANYVPGRGDGRQIIYEQTFFTNRPKGDESHLLSWYEPVSKENRKRVDDALMSVSGNPMDWTGVETGQDLYRKLANFASPREASEFLAHYADIDGVKYPAEDHHGRAIGNAKGWNYVSFRDDNIRVDHKWTDGVAKFAVGKAPNGKPSNLDERQQAEVRTPEFKRFFGNWENAAKGAAIKSQKPVVVTARPKGVSVRDAYSQLADGENVYDRRKVRFVMSTLGKILRHKGYPAERIVHQLKDIYDNAVPIGFQEEQAREGHKKHPNFVGYHNYVGKIADGGREYYVRITVQEERTRSKTYNPNAVHSTFVSDVELYKESDLLALNTANSAGKVGAVANDRGALSRSTTSVGERERGPITDKILANFLAEGKGASKIVDENGEPMVVYRGAEFDPLAQETGKGVIKPEAYFTASPEYARRYAGSEGKVRAYYLNIRKPFDIRNPECLKDFEKIYPGQKLSRGKSGALDWAEASTIDGEFLEENFPGKYDGIIFDEASDWAPEGNLPEWRGLSYVPLHGGQQVKSATDNAGTFDPGNPDVRFMVGSGRKLDSSVFIAGRARVADDAGVGEQTPGALAASRELATQGATPISLMGQFRKMSLPMSEIEHLRRLATGDRLPVHVARRMPGGRAAAHTRAGQLFIAADVFGTVDKTDMEHEKAFLRQHGFFMNEDANWCSNQTGAAIRAEQRRSEEQLATRLLHLGSRRVRGVEPGGQEAGRRVLADEVAKIVMDLPQQLGGTLGRVQTIGKGVRDDIRRRLNGSNDQAKREAGDFLDWAYGSGIVDPATGNTVARADAMALDELTSSMFGAWLVMPHEVEMRAPNWDAAFVSAIAGDQRLTTAWRELSVRAFTERSHSHVEAKIRQQLERGTQAALMKLQQEADSPISAGSRMADLKETMLVGFHDKFAPVYVRVDEKLKDFIKAKKAAIRTATSALDRQMLRAEIDRFGGQMAAKLHKLELSRTASERGAWNEGRRYWLEMARLENDATRWGLTEEDKSLYLELKRVVETQGRAASFMQDARQAQMSLDDMKRRLGAAGFARLEDYTRRFHAIIEREIYDDARLERALGKGLVDYFRSQSDYVTTKRTWSKDELDAIETARADARAAGVAGGDDVVSGMYRYAGARGAGDVVGLSASEWTAALKGSAAARQESRSATWAKQSGLMQFARRNQMVLDLRDVLLSAGVEGVRELSATEGGSFPKGNRYGHIAFMENGQKKMLVVPTQMAEAFKADPDVARWITWLNGCVRKSFIDYNVAYWGQNVKRNQDSIEKNMPGTRETYLKTFLRAFVPGASPIMDLTLQALVRRAPKTAVLFNDHTVFAHIPKAERYARILEDLSGWQKELWAAEDAHDAAKVTRMYDDYAGVMEMLKGNFLTPTSAAYAGGDKTHGFAFDAMNRKGMKTLAQIEEESQGDKKWSKFVRKVNVFRMNAAQQEHEEILAKTIAYLHDRAHYSMERSVAESGLMVKKNVSIAEGERKGRLARPIQQAMAQFFNMIEKGATRHWRNVKERPGEMLAKDGKVWIGRAMGMMLANGAARAWMLADSDGDEEKARQKYGLVYDYAAAYHTAWKNCSNYVKETYNFTPLWNSKDGMTSVVLGGALTDEDKLIVPTADFVANMAAHKMGVAPKPEIGKTLANATFKAVTPDLAMASPVMNILRSTVEAALIDNPTDYFRGAPMYDPSLWEVRYESWEMFGKFSAAVGAKLWSDLGGRAIWAPDVYGVDNGRGNAPETVEAALRKIPVASPAIARMVKIQVGSPAKHGEAITAEAKRQRAIIDVCAKDLMRQVDSSGVDVWERDPEGYERQLATWKERYGLNDLDVMRLRVKYLNGTIQRKNRMGYDQRELGKLRKKARELGMTDEEIWLQLGDM